MPKQKIFAFVAGPAMVDDLYIVAIHESGEFLASHISSSEGFGKHDIGVTGNWKHNVYDEFAGTGNWEIEWVDQPESHEGCKLAIERNKSLGSPDDHVVAS